MRMEKITPYKFIVVPWEDAQAGDIGFGFNKSFIGRAIRRFTDGRVNHAFIVAARDVDSVVCHEAIAKGYKVTHRPLDDDGVETLLRLESDDEAGVAVSRRRIVEESAKLIAQHPKYDFIDIARFAIPFLKPKNHKGHVFCSEATTICLERALRIDLGVPSLQSPADLRERLLNYPEVPPSLR